MGCRLRNGDQSWKCNCWCLYYICRKQQYHSRTHECEKEHATKAGTAATFMNSPQHSWRYGAVSVCLGWLYIGRWFVNVSGFLDRGGHFGMCEVLLVSLGVSRKTGEFIKVPIIWWSAFPSQCKRGFGTLREMIPWIGIAWSWLSVGESMIAICSQLNAWAKWVWPMAQWQVGGRPWTGIAEEVR
jgi:hypothetical protein